MTQPPKDPPVQKLQPVAFTKISDYDGHLAVYRALVEDSAKSGTVFSLTATTASPGDGELGTAMLRSLNEIRAAFFVLDKPSPNPVTMEPEPFYPETEVMIEIGVAKSARKGPVSFDMIVQGTVPAGQPRTIRKGGRDETWHTSINNVSATVNVTVGMGTIAPKAKLLPDPHGYNAYNSAINTSHEYLTKESHTVTLHTDSKMTYTLYGNGFTLPI